MENDVIKNKIAPWQSKGRWFHVFIESDGTTPKITFSDIPDATVATTYLTFFGDFRIIDVKCADIDLTSGKTYTAPQITNRSGRPGVVIPAVATYTYLDLWIFGYFK